MDLLPTVPIARPGGAGKSSTFGIFARLTRRRPRRAAGRAAEPRSTPRPTARTAGAMIGHDGAAGFPRSPRRPRNSRIGPTSVANLEGILILWIDRPAYTNHPRRIRPTRPPDPDKENAMPEIEADRLMTRREAAALLGIRPTTLACWASSGRWNLPYFRVGGAARYRRADLETWLTSRAAPTSQDGRGHYAPTGASSK